VRRGFTLIELLLIVAILGVMAVVLVPNFSLLDRAQVSIAATDTLRIMRYARNMALQTQQPIAITFSPGAIRVAAAFDAASGASAASEAPADDAAAKEGEDPPAAKPNDTAVNAGAVDTLSLTKTYPLVAFDFLGYDDTVLRRSAKGAVGFTRRDLAQNADEEEASAGETFTVTVRANGTVRPFTLRVRERDAEESAGDVIAVDFLCSGSISE